MIWTMDLSSRKWQNKSLHKQKILRFEPAVLREHYEPLPNPARGWYQVYAFDVSAPVDFDKLRWCLHPQDKLALLLLDIGSCRERALSEKELARVHGLLSFFAEHTFDLIVRVVYDREGMGIKREPRTLTQVQQHMEQFGPLLEEFAEQILVVQGLFVGSWGEMHHSAFVTPTALRTLAKTLWRAMRGSCTLAVRKPVQWRLLCREEENPAQKVALFDDAIFGSETHLGTFADGQTPENNWTKMWSPQEELAFEEERFFALPNGGEALRGECLDFETIQERMRRMHIGYLNRVYDEKRIGEWKEIKVMLPGKKEPVSGFEKIGLYLGYRFVIRGVKGSRAKVRRTPQTGEKTAWSLSVCVENTGFGNLTKQAVCTLVLSDESGKCVRVPVETDARTWNCGTYTHVQIEIPSVALASLEGRIKAGLMLQRRSDKSLIYFANGHSDDGVCLGWFH